MRWLALLLLMPNLSFGAIAANTVLLLNFENNGNDDSGNGYHMATKGSLSYATSNPAPKTGLYSLSATASNNYLSTTAAAAVAAVSGVQVGTIQFWSYRSARTTNNYPCGFTANFFCQAGDATGDSISYANDNTRLNYDPGDVRGAWHHVAITWGSNYRRIYFDGSLTASVDARNGLTPAVSAIKIGAFATVDTVLTSYLDQFRFSNADMSSGGFPTQDLTTAPNSRSIRLQNMLRLKLGSYETPSLFYEPLTKAIARKLWGPWLFASVAHAVEENGPKASQIYMVDWEIKDKADKDKKVKKTETFTPSPTRSPSFTPSPTATPTRVQ